LRGRRSSFVLGALALDFCAFALLLRHLALVRGLVRLVLFIPDVGAAFVCGHGALVGALDPFVRRYPAVPRARLAVLHRVQRHGRRQRRSARKGETDVEGELRVREAAVLLEALIAEVPGAATA
jgi:hypothetical protein